MHTLEEAGRPPAGGGDGALGRVSRSTNPPPSTGVTHPGALSDPTAAGARAPLPPERGRAVHSPGLRVGLLHGEAPHYLEGRDHVRYRDQPDKSLHQPGTAMHHPPKNRERTLNLSIQPSFGPGKIPRVESN